MIVSINKELESIWKKVVLAYFKALPWHFPVGPDENQGKLVFRSISEPGTSRIRNRIY
jgi:hypothetical protein